MELLHEELTNVIIKTFYEVYNELGYGFLEKVYQNSLFLELRNLIVEDLVILELKAAEYIVKDFENQILNYLRSTDCEVGLLLNFGKKPEFKRKIFENYRK